MFVDFQPRTMDLLSWKSLCPPKLPEIVCVLCHLLLLVTLANTIRSLCSEQEPVEHTGDAGVAEGDLMDTTHGECLMTNGVGIWWILMLFEQHRNDPGRYEEEERRRRRRRGRIRSSPRAWIPPNPETPTVHGSHRSIFGPN